MKCSRRISKGLYYPRDLTASGHPSGFDKLKMTADGFAANAKGDEKKEFENKHSDKAFRCKQEKKTADLSRAHTCRM